MGVIDDFKNEYEKAHGKRPIVLFKKRCLMCSPHGTYFVKRPLVSTFDPGMSPNEFRWITQELKDYNK